MNNEEKLKKDEIKSLHTVVISGYRYFNDYDLFCKCIDKYPTKITRINEGECKGTDIMAKRYAKENNIECSKYPADWNTYGNGAGVIRNELMIYTAQGLIVFCDKKSIGTKDIIKKAKILDVPTTIWNVNYNRNNGRWEILE